MSSSSQARAYEGSTFFSHGYRPFFLYAGIWGGLSMLVWILFLSTGNEIPTRMVGVDWHMHEMVFGYGSAVIAGFLLTAIPNWTGRLPIMGWPTALLSGLWVLGRVALFFSAYLPLYLAPVLDSAFLIVLCLVIGREIIAGKNWRNLKIVMIIGALAIINVFFHVEAHNSIAYEGYSIRLGVGMIILLISIVGGRVIPSFTRNWLKRQSDGPLPTPFNTFDKYLLIATGATLILWVAFPGHVITRGATSIVGISHLFRVWRWAGWRTFSEPMLAILHISYVFIPIGFLTIGLGDMLPGWQGETSIPHAFTAGAIGSLTLAMMSRVSLGHSGRPIKATWPVTTLYALILGAAVFRIWAEMDPSSVMLLHLSATLWIASFAGFVAIYIPILTRPKLQK